MKNVHGNSTRFSFDMFDYQRIKAQLLVSLFQLQTRVHWKSSIPALAPDSHISPHRGTAGQAQAA